MLQWWKNATRPTNQHPAKQPTRTPAIMEPAEPRLLLSTAVNSLDFNALAANFGHRSAPIIVAAGPGGGSH